MRRLILLLWICSGMFYCAEICAQQKGEEEGHKLIFHIKDAQDQTLYLTIHHRDKLYLRDSTKMSKPGVYIFEGDGKYEDGLYSLVSEKRTTYLNFIIDNNYHFEYFLDTTDNVLHFSVNGSPENSEMLSFQQKTHVAQQAMQEANERRIAFKNVGNQDSANFYLNKQKAINDEVEEFIKQLIDRNPDYLFSKLQKAFQPIDVPDLANAPDEAANTAFQATYYLTHYWDNVDLADSRFIYLPVLEEKYQEYFNQILFFAESDTINKYVDLFLSKTEPDSVMFRYMLNRLTFEFESSKLLGHDAVFIHIAKNYHLKGKCTWLDEETIVKYQKRVVRLEPLLIGQPGPELIIPDTSGINAISSHTPKEKYVVLWFFDPTCQTCKRESAKLKLLYDSLTLTGTRNFEVYAIGNDDDLERWKNYVRDNQFKWLNVGGHTGNINYLEAYNIYETGNPTMFILDEKRNIILNKRIDANTIPFFLEQHEVMVRRRIENWKDKN